MDPHDFLNSVFSLEEQKEKQKKLVDSLLVLSQPSNTDFTLIHPKVFSMGFIEREILSIESFLKDLLMRLYQIFEVNNKHIDPFICGKSVLNEEEVDRYIIAIVDLINFTKATHCDSGLSDDQLRTELSFSFSFDRYKLRFFLVVEVALKASNFRLSSKCELKKEL